MALADVGLGGQIMDWPTAAVLIATVLALMIVLTTYIAARKSKK
jgi:hypothetical protein